MERNQKIFNNIAKLYLMIRNGLMNNNISFDHLLNELIENIENSFNSCISKSLLYSKNSLKDVFKYWMSVYGLILNYGYEFVLIGYLGNDFDVIQEPDFLFKNIPNISPEMGVDFMSMLNSIKTESLNQDALSLKQTLTNDVLANCILNIDTKKVLNGNLFASNANKLLNDYQTMKSCMDNKQKQKIIIDTLVSKILDENHIFYKALLNYKNAHNKYAYLRLNNETKILDYKDKYDNIYHITEQLIHTLSNVETIFNGLIFQTNVNTHSIVDINSILVNNSLAQALNQQYEKEFNLWDDIFYPVGGMSVSFKETSLSEYVDNILGINVLYKYSHISYLSQSEIAIYLEQVINLFSYLYIQTINKYQVNIDFKIFNNLGFQLKKVLKDFYPKIINYINSISYGTIEMGSVVYSSLYNPEEIMQEINGK